MQVQDVIRELIGSYNITSDSLPPIVNLLGVTKKQKEDTIKQAYRDYILHNKQSILFLSVCTSSSLFSWILLHAPKICYWKNRVTQLGKRYNLIILYFCAPETLCQKH